MHSCCGPQQQFEDKGTCMKAPPTNTHPHADKTRHNRRTHGHSLAARTHRHHCIQMHERGRGARLAYVLESTQRAHKHSAQQHTSSTRPATRSPCTRGVGHWGTGVRHLPCKRSRPMWAAAGGGFIGRLRRRRRQLRRQHRALPVQARGTRVGQRTARKIRHSSFNRLDAACGMRHATPRKRCRPARALLRLRTDRAMRVVRRCAVRLRDACIIYR